MKVINSDQGYLQYPKIFKKLQHLRIKIVIWQVFPENSRRVVTDSLLTSFSPEKKLLFLSLVNEFIDPSLPLYFYVEDGQFIFKSQIMETAEDYFSVAFPNEIKLLEEKEVSSIRISIGMDISGYWKTKRLVLDDLDEDNVMRVKRLGQTTRDQEFLRDEFDLMPTLEQEDEMFAGQRESKRIRPKDNKKVLIKRLDAEPSFFALFDLSQGGMGFLCNKPADFPKGLTIQVVGFGEFNLDDPLIGTIVAVRPVDEFELDFKIGVKFET